MVSLGTQVQVCWYDKDGEVEHQEEGLVVGVNRNRFFSSSATGSHSLDVSISKTEDFEEKDFLYDVMLALNCQILKNVPEFILEVA